MGIENCEFSRRELIQIFTPGSWLIDALKGHNLSRASKGSLAVDLATIPALALACSSTGQSEVPPRVVRAAATPAAKDSLGPEIGRQRLIQELDVLPSSPIRDLLQERVKPFYQSIPPETINRGGLEIRIFNPTVKFSIVGPPRGNEPFLLGVFTARPNENYPKGEGPFLPIGRIIRQVPYPLLILDRDKPRLDPKDLASDGTLLIGITFNANTPVQDGIWPLININAPESSSLTPAQRRLYGNRTRFAYIKEACTQLVYDLWLEEVISKINSLRLNPYIEVLKPDNSIGRIEIVTSSITTMNNSSHGRLEAVLDLAGYLVAFKAVEKSDINAPRNLDDQGFKKARPLMEATNLGNTPHDILSRAFDWVLTTPEAGSLIHVGNLERIP